MELLGLGLMGAVWPGKVSSLADFGFHLVSGSMVPKGFPTIKGLCGPWTAYLTWFTPIHIFFRMGN